MIPTRIYRPWTDWECYKAGFYATSYNIEDNEAKELYKNFLSNLKAFNLGIDRVFKEWPNSCEHFLTNSAMNRVAWIGQAAMCITTGIPSKFKGGFKLLNENQQNAANQLAKRRLEEWLSQYCNKE